jgi:hypothetical protein
MSELPIRDRVVAANDDAWRAISGAGAFWTGEERLAIVAETRQALNCSLCAARREALSPFNVEGDHEHLDALPAAAVDVIHRMRTDAGRLTRAWFDTIVPDQLSVEAYVDLVSVVATSVILDSYAQTMALGLPGLPPAEPGRPTGKTSDEVVSGVAWVPIMAVDQTTGEKGLPDAPNIVRSMARVPSAMMLFFSAFRPHYTIYDFEVSLARPQMELIAARVSALNQCFY